MILNVRGPSCSGKSTAVRYLLDRYPSSEVWQDGWLKTKQRLVGHTLKGNLLVAGGYKSLEVSKTGGLDTMVTGTHHTGVKRIDMVDGWLETCARSFSHLVFEGMTVSTTTGRWHRMEDRLRETGAPALPWAYAFLDTPFDVCLERMHTRSGREPNEKVASDTWKRIRRLRDRFASEGRLVYDLDWQCAGEQAVLILQQHGWSPE